ncbi:hypothetical protein GJ697_20655 [Pseudoduganella sp. FT25W]|uniref:Uncharacterized protein n=1 Tax=Duganella alba TaxID=2666081 RepID=A0A6L5QKK9_9BURK|nr:hypothetical protein [Duganella alba]MRX10249.1 hypothetical protein [Duganella alba]MRX18536.1 hypothetical protein [Duganella alba]
MSIIIHTKRSAGMVLGDFFALVGIMAAMTGSQTFGGFMLISGIGIYATTAATRWAIAKIASLWRGS